MKNTLSVCLVIYNEEKVIERCLKSIEGIADEIIIVHDGNCDDNSLKICEKYTKNIYIQPHIGVAEPHRPFAFEKANCEWILNLDADEYLSNELKESIIGLIASQEIDAYTFIWPYTDGKKQFSLKFPPRLCLARKSKMFFFGFPCESIQTTGKVGKTNLILEHWPKYNNYTISRFITKIIPWIKINANYIWSDPYLIKSFNTTDISYIINVQNSYRNNPLLKIPYRFIKIIVLQASFWKALFNGIIKVVLFSAFYEAVLLYYVYKYRKRL